MTTHKKYSQLSRINAVAGHESVPVDSRVLEVLRSSLRWADRTSGTFDVTTLPLLRAYGFRGEEGEVIESVEKAREVVGAKFIAIEGDRAGLTRNGAMIDVGGIAKGYAVDRAAALLRDKWDITKAIVEAGGDLYCLGRPEDAAGWKIGVAHPTRSGDICATIELADCAVATSGSTQTRITRDGKTMTDIFDPRTGEPVQSWLSLSARAANCMDADAASTTLFALGFDLDPTEPYGEIDWFGVTGAGASVAATTTTDDFEITHL
jgi:thiamine biosynthesis lipoprotein